MFSSVDAEETAPRIKGLLNTKGWCSWFLSVCKWIRGKYPHSPRWELTFMCLSPSFQIVCVKKNLGTCYKGLLKFCTTTRRCLFVLQVMWFAVKNRLLCVVMSQKCVIYGHVGQAEKQKIPGQQVGSGIKLQHSDSVVILMSDYCSRGHFWPASCDTVLIAEVELPDAVP